MNRSALRRVIDPRQLDLFSFKPVLVPAIPEEPPPLAPILQLPPVETVVPAEPPEPLKPQLFQITDFDRLGDGSPRQKCRSNLTAIELLKQIETEQRPATECERRQIVKFVGWGGLPQVFDEFNRDWAEERQQLEALLTPEELSSARATTLNAHYTSPTIIRAMYAALEQFGYTGGRILEPACGLGHFIGLMPC
jgi:hypothetical protein